MALLELNFDTTNKTLVAGLNNPDVVSLPTLGQEEGITLKIRVLKKVSRLSPPFFEVMNMSGYGLHVSVGTVGSVLASQSSWDVDASSGMFTGTLSLNTVGINALTDGSSVYLEIRLFDGVNYYRKRFSARYEKAIAVAGSPQPIAGDTALGSLEADRTYLRKEGRAGEGFILTSPDGTKKGLIYWGDDNSLHTESIT